MQVLEYLFGSIGAFICHQLPARTIFLDGRPLPLCARDTGIYIGIFTALLYIAVRKRFGADRPPDIFSALLLCFMMLPMMLDGVSSYLGLRDSNNVLRLYSGVLFGIALPVFLVPAANFRVDAPNTRGIVKHRLEVPLLAACGLLLSTAMTRPGFTPWVLTASIIILTFMFFIGLVVYTIVARTGIVRHRTLVVVCLTMGVFFILGVFSSFVLQPLRGMFLER